MIKQILSTVSVFDLPQRLIKQVQCVNSVFVMLFLFVFEPFQLHRSSTMDLLSVCAVTGLGIAITGVGCFTVFKRLLEKYCVRRKYYVYAELVMACIIITLMTLLLFATRLLQDKIPMNFHLLFYFLSYSVLMAPFLFLSLRLVLIIRELILIANTQPTRLPTTEDSTQKSQVITLDNLTANETISFLLEDFVFVRADGNYLELNLVQSGELKMVLLRCTLKLFAQHIKAHDQCIQCHRSYWVNLEKVTRMSRGDGNTRLILLADKASIPVSRTNIKTVTDFFN